MYKIGLSPIVTWDEAQYVRYSESGCQFRKAGVMLTYERSTALGNLDRTISNENSTSMFILHSERCWSDYQVTWPDTMDLLNSSLVKPIQKN